MLGEALGCGKEQLILAYPDDINPQVLSCYQRLLQQRGDGTPVSYIRHKKEFYGLEYYVDERVLVPRPDTETLIEEARDILQTKSHACILDLCTGSGCLAITLKHLFPHTQVTGADISQAAGEVFTCNAAALLGHPLPFILSDLFKNITETYDLIISNPPYIRREEAQLMKEIGWPEPLLALDGGADGAEILSKIIEAAPYRLAAGGILLLEADPEQIKKCTQKMEECEYIDIGTRRDLGGRERIVRGARP